MPATLQNLVVEAFFSPPRVVTTTPTPTQPRRSLPDPLATAGLDVMPHNGAVITALAVVGLTHREAYKPIFFMAMLTPLFTNVIVVALAAVFFA